MLEIINMVFIGLAWGHSFIQQTTVARWDCQPPEV